MGIREGAEGQAPVPLAYEATADFDRAYEQLLRTPGPGTRYLLTDGILTAVCEELRTFGGVGFLRPAQEDDHNLLVRLRGIFSPTSAIKPLEENESC